ncbi:MAG: hypothetical protein Q8O67_22675 [Deltaproteobacteria bacterium]|nr:hypothetical protein [Deltaproteobacteria bacterium]
MKWFVVVVVAAAVAACPCRTIDDDVEVENQAEVDELADVCGISGFAHFLTSAETLDLPLLATVGGDLIIDNNQVMTSISMPLLTEVVGRLSVQVNDSLVRFDAPALDVAGLEAAGGQLELQNNQSLTEFKLPSLRGLAFLTVQNNGILELLSLPVLELESSNVSITNNGSLAQCVGDAITGVGDCVQ